MINACGDEASWDNNNRLHVAGPTSTPEPTDTPKPSGTPAPTSTPGPTEYIRPVIVVESYGASSAVILPGQNLDFEITLRNNGRVTATNIVATFVPGDFTPRVTGGVNAVGDLAPGASARFFQPLTAGESLEGLTQGSLEVKVAYTDSNAQKYEETFTLTFAVQEVVDVTETYTPTPSATPSLRPQLLIGAYNIDAPTLQPGTRFTLALDIRNVGNTGAERVSMVFGGGSASPGAIGTGVAGGGVAGAGGEFDVFAPLDSSNVQFLGDVGTGAQVSARQRMIVNAAAEPGAYAVKFSFLYSDDKGGNYTDEQVITLLVESRPLVDVGFYREAGVLLSGQPNLLPLQVVNLSRSTVVLGGLEVTAPNAEFSNNITLIGSLDAGGYFTLDATVIPQQAGPLELTITIDYTDDFNQAQVITQTLSVEVQEGAPAPLGPEGVGGGGGNGEFPGAPGEAAAAGPETFGQKAWRFALGMIGLDSGRPEPAQVLPPPAFEQEQRGAPVE